jgi:two-component system, OmpR family, sensor histidine kinase BaeS
MARRLIVSYLALVALTVALLAGILYLATSQTFSRYLNDQAAAHNEMLPVMLAGYHTEHGTWDGVQPNIEQASILIGGQVTLADVQGRIVAATRRDLIGRAAGEVSDLGMPITVAGSGGRVMGTIFVQRSVAAQRADADFLASVTRALVIAGLVVALLAAGLGVLLARSISRPLSEMSSAASRLSQGDYAVQVPARGQDEVAALGRAFNQMAEGMAGVERLRRELVANVSHDLRTPLTVIRGYLEGLHSGEIADRRSAEIAFEAMYGEVNRLLHLVDDLRQVAALDAGASQLQRCPTFVADLARDALARIEPVAQAKGVILANEVPLDLPAVSLDPGRMGQALFNLLENAVRHTPSGGRITMLAGRAKYPNGPGEHLWLTVQDTGEGIAPEQLPHVFERFYRADPARSPSEGGAGLGLSITHSIVEAHSGLLTAQSDGIPGHGASFTLFLPL